jgi:YD repeat-containing protein
LILNEKHYKIMSDNSFSLIREKKYNYTFLENGNEPTRKIVNGVKAASREFWNYPFSNDQLLNAAMTMSGYHTAAEYYWMKTDTLIDYDMTSSQIVSNAKFYNYRTNPLQLTSVQTKSSKGDLLATGYLYPNDFASQVPYNTMVQRNQLQPVIQQVDTVNGVAIRTVRSVYKDWGNGIILPQKVQAQVRSNPMEDRLLFNQYDAYGNIIEQQKINDVKEAFFWGYNHEYPVAKVSGSDYNTAKQYIDIDLLNNTQSYTDDQVRSGFNALRVNLPMALVSTYTYSPLTGMTSETDASGKTTYYEYDSFNRLSIVRDNGNNIVKKICYNYQGQQGSCGEVMIYVNDVQSKTYTKGNCLPGGIPSSVTYTIPEGKYSSTISKQDANNKARTDLDANGPGYANTNGTCTYTNDPQSKTFTKGDCGTGGAPSSITYTVPEGKYSSLISKQDANNMALADLDANGPGYANANGFCTYYNDAQSKVYTRSDCAPGGTPSSVTYTVPENKYSSIISKQDANNKALADLDANGPGYANINGSCTFYNAARSQSYTKQDCPSNGTPSAVTYTVPYAKYSSTISQADADAQAQNDINTNAQNYANANGYCTFYNEQRGQSITKNDCAYGGQPSYVTYVVPQGKYSSTISQEDANAKAQNEINANGQSYANASGYCTFYSIKASIILEKNDCSTGHGSEVTYTVPAGTYTSRVSQGEADAAALEDVRQNAQRYTNENGTCLFGNDYMTQWFTKNDCPTGYEGTPVAYTVRADSYIASTKAEANQLAQNEINNNGQANANNNGTCKLVEACPGCSGESQKCINNICTTGMKVYTQSVPLPSGNYQCTYHYEWPDGTWSGNYDEISGTPCNGSVEN